MRKLLAAAAWALPLAPAAGQQEAAVFERLQGSWRGEGALLGRTAVFSMRWELRPGDVAVLTFDNAFVDSAGARTPVLSATAVYRTTPERADAHWADSRGVVIRIRWEATDSTLVSHWEAPTERGRTEYRRVGPALEVVDRVQRGDELAVFATARYERVDGEIAPPHPALAPAAWVAGCWRRGSGDAFQEERWSPASGDAMVGINRTVRNGRLVAHEYLQIRMVEGRPAYVALPSGQAETVFPLIEATEGSLVFENPEHDFPQRVGYERTGRDGLMVWIEGDAGSGMRRVPFPFLRVSCDP